ncbi:MAG: ABC transporter ATP-binding protein [Clostridia bacterium]|nr:ABC transporter ATP-binding protein [Clostridia bacterium]
MQHSIIEVTHLSKSYGEKKVVKDLSFSVQKGTVLGLLGANGAGKTTSIECILGTKKRNSGSITILGKDPRKDRKELFQKIGVQFQDASYQHEISVKELCEETESIYKHPQDYKMLLKQFGIADKEKSLVKSLSGGERQRLFITLALIPQPEIVFLDELTTGLDARARREVWNVLKTLKSNGMTMILTSHFMDEIEALCDEIIILKKGNVEFKGTVKEAIDKSPFEHFEDAYLWYSDEERDDELLKEKEEA